MFTVKTRQYPTTDTCRATLKTKIIQTEMPFTIETLHTQTILSIDTQSTHTIYSSNTLDKMLNTSRYTHFIFFFNDGETSPGPPNPQLISTLNSREK